MASSLEKAARIPFDLKPVQLLLYYITVCTLSGNIITASETIKHLMRMRDTFAEQGPHKQELFFIDATSLGVSASIIGAVFAGLLNDYVGPRITAMLGQVLSAASMIFIFFSPPESKVGITFGCCLLGCVYSCVSISHTHVAALFVKNSTLAITMLSVGNDLSLAVPLFMSWVAEYIGVQTAAMCYIGLNIAFLVSEFFLVPDKSFSLESLEMSPHYKPPTTALTEHSNAALVSRASIESYGAVAVLPAPASEEDSLKKAPIWKQIATSHYWGLVIFISFSFFRRIHYQQLVRMINIAAAAASGAPLEDALQVVEWFKRTAPLATFGSFCNGVFTNYYGIYPGMVAVNTWGVLMCFFSSFENLTMQYFAIAFCNLYAGFIFGFMYAFLGKFYGFATLGQLQGVLKIICGGVGALMSPWIQHVVLEMPSILMSNKLLFIVGVAAYLLPLVMWWWPINQSTTTKSNKNTSACV